MSVFNCSNEGFTIKRMNEAEIERRRAEIKRASKQKELFNQN